MSRSESCQRTYDSEAHDEGPETSFGVGLDSLPKALLVLLVFAIKGIVHEVVVGQDFGIGNVDVVRAVAGSVLLVNASIFAAAVDAGDVVPVVSDTR